MNYQLGTVLPWWVKRYVLRRKGAKCPELYKFETQEEYDEEYAKSHPVEITNGHGSGSDDLTEKDEIRKDV